MKIVAHFLLPLLAAAAAFAGAEDKKTVEPPQEENRWKFLLASPGWAPWLEGDTGINGLITHLNLAPGDIIRNYDMAFALRAEASNGRFGILAEALYTSISDGIGTPTAVKKVDVQVDQTIAELALRWRVMESPRGYLDLIGGVRYVNLFQQAVTQSNEERIDEISDNLVDAAAGRLRRPGPFGARGLVARALGTPVEAFDPEHPADIPIGPVDAPLGDRVRSRVQRILESRRAELRARVQAVEAADAGTKARAQARLNALKKEISRQIANTVEDKLETRVARVDDWWDPFVGLRARFNLNDRFYLIGKGDVGGFGAGSRLSWSAEAALGWQMTPSIYSEIGYRALSLDYEEDGLTFDVVMHGAQVTLGILF